MKLFESSYAPLGWTFLLSNPTETLACVDHIGWWAFADERLMLNQRTPFCLKKTIRQLVVPAAHRTKQNSFYRMSQISLTNWSFLPLCFSKQALLHEINYASSRIFSPYQSNSSIFDILDYMYYRCYNQYVLLITCLFRHQRSSDAWNLSG